MKFKKIISSGLALGLIFNNISVSLAGVISEDGRYETFEGNNITVDNILEEDKVDIEIEGNTMVNVANQKDAVPITKSYTVEGTNHILLQGEYDGKARPIIEGNTMYYNNDTGELIDTFVEGADLSLISSFEDTYIPENISTVKSLLPFKITSDSVSLNRNIFRDNDIEFKPNTTYTFVIDVSDIKNTNLLSLSTVSGVSYDTYITPKEGVNIVSITTNDSPSEFWMYYARGTDSSCTINRFMVLEGDWEHNLPDYEEVDKYSGKYKVEYKVTGTNKIDESKLTTGYLIDDRNILVETLNCNVSDYIKVKKGNIYTIPTGISSSGRGVNFYDENKVYVSTTILSKPVGTSETFTAPIDGYMRVNLWSDGFPMQMNEGESLIEYEPYKESVKTFYLNSPLLEGDTIEDVNGKATHVKRYKKIIFDGSNDEEWFLNTLYAPGAQYVSYASVRDYMPKSFATIYSDKLKYIGEYNGVEDCIWIFNDASVVIQNSTISNIEEFRQYLEFNPLTLVYKLKTPIYETISEESILTDSYLNGHLDLNSNISVNKVDFMPTDTSLNYLYPSTEYTVQFKSDNIGEINSVSIGNEVACNNYSVTKGVNRFNITTPDTISSTKLVIDGLGFNLSNLVVTEAIEEDFDYFEGIKSVGELKDNKLEIKSENKNLVKNIILGGINNDTGKPNSSNNNLVRSEDYIPIKPNVTYTISNDLSYNNYIYEYDINKNFIKFHRARVNPYTFTTSNNTKYILFRSTATEMQNDLSVKYQIEEGVSTTNYEKYSSNNIEIVMREPLRGLPNGVKDRIIKRNGQWIIERKVGKIILDNASNVAEVYADGDSFTQFNINFNEHNLNNWECITENFINVRFTNTIDSEAIAMHHQKLIVLKIKNSKARTKEELDVWLRNNPIEALYELATPIYEPIDINAVVTLYEETTHISNNSTMPCNMKVTVDRAINKAIEAIQIAKENPTIENISQARYWANLMKETIKKDEVNNQINDITTPVDLNIEKKKASANVDVYVKSDNSLSMTLSTNSITFDKYTGADDIEKNNALEITVHSSLPYDLNAYLEDNIQNSDKSVVMDSNLLQIKESTDVDYKSFINTKDKIILTENNSYGNYKKHNIDLKIEGSNAYKADVYKAVIKFEAEQK